MSSPEEIAKAQAVADYYAKQVQPQVVPVEPEKPNSGLFMPFMKAVVARTPEYGAGWIGGLHEVLPQGSSVGDWFKEFANKIDQMTPDDLRKQVEQTSATPWFEDDGRPWYDPLSWSPSRLPELWAKTTSMIGENMPILANSALWGKVASAMATSGAGESMGLSKAIASAPGGVPGKALTAGGMITAGLIIPSIPMTIMEMRNYAKQAEKMGLPEDIAAQYGRYYGLFAGVTEQMQSLTTMGLAGAGAVAKPVFNVKILGKVGKILGLPSVETMFEGVEEVTQDDFMNRMLKAGEAAAKERDPNWSSAIGPVQDLTFGDRVDSFAGGALIGGAAFLGGKAYRLATGSVSEERLAENQALRNKLASLGERAGIKRTKGLEGTDYIAIRQSDATEIADKLKEAIDDESNRSSWYKRGAISTMLQEMNLQMGNDQLHAFDVKAFNTVYEDKGNVAAGRYLADKYNLPIVNDEATTPEIFQKIQDHMNEAKLKFRQVFNPATGSLEWIAEQQLAEGEESPYKPQDLANIMYGHGGMKIKYSDYLKSLEETLAGKEGLYTQEVTRDSLANKELMAKMFAIPYEMKDGKITGTESDMQRLDNRISMLTAYLDELKGPNDKTPRIIYSFATHAKFTPDEFKGSGYGDNLAPQKDGYIHRRMGALNQWRNGTPYLTLFNGVGAHGIVEDIAELAADRDPATIQTEQQMKALSELQKDIIAWNKQIHQNLVTLLESKKAEKLPWQEDSDGSRKDALKSAIIETRSILEKGEARVSPTQRLNLMSRLGGIDGTDGLLGEVIRAKVLNKEEAKNYWDQLKEVKGQAHILTELDKLRTLYAMEPRNVDTLTPGVRERFSKAFSLVHAGLASQTSALQASPYSYLAFDTVKREGEDLSMADRITKNMRTLLGGNLYNIMTKAAGSFTAPAFDVTELQQKKRDTPTNFTLGQPVPSTSVEKNENLLERVNDLLIKLEERLGRKPTKAEASRETRKVVNEISRKPVRPISTVVNLDKMTSFYSTLKTGEKVQITKDKKTGVWSTTINGKQVILTEPQVLAYFQRGKTVQKPAVRTGGAVQMNGKPIVDLDRLDLGASPLVETPPKQAITPEPISTPTPESPKVPSEDVSANKPVSPKPKPATPPMRPAPIANPSSDQEARRKAMQANFAQHIAKNLGIRSQSEEDIVVGSSEEADAGGDINTSDDKVSGKVADTVDSADERMIEMLTGDSHISRLLDAVTAMAGFRTATRHGEDIVFNAVRQNNSLFRLAAEDTPEGKRQFDALAAGMADISSLTEDEKAFATALSILFNPSTPELYRLDQSKYRSLIRYMSKMLKFQAITARVSRGNVQILISNTKKTWDRWRQQIERIMPGNIMATIDDGERFTGQEYAAWLKEYISTKDGYLDPIKASDYMGKMTGIAASIWHESFLNEQAGIPRVTADKIPAGRNGTSALASGISNILFQMSRTGSDLATMHENGQLLKLVRSSLTMMSASRKRGGAISPIKALALQSKDPSAIDGIYPSVVGKNKKKSSYVLRDRFLDVIESFLAEYGVGIEQGIVSMDGAKSGRKAHEWKNLLYSNRKAIRSAQFRRGYVELGQLGDKTRGNYIKLVDLPKDFAPQFREELDEVYGSRILAKHKVLRSLEKNMLTRYASVYKSLPKADQAYHLTPAKMAAIHSGEGALRLETIAYHLYNMDLGYRMDGTIANYKNTDDYFKRRSQDGTPGISYEGPIQAAVLDDPTDIQVFKDMLGIDRFSKMFDGAGFVADEYTRKYANYMGSILSNNRENPFGIKAHYKDQNLLVKVNWYNIDTLASENPSIAGKLADWMNQHGVDMVFFAKTGMKVGKLESNPFLDKQGNVILPEKPILHTLDGSHLYTPLNLNHDPDVEHAKWPKQQESNTIHLPNTVQRQNIINKLMDLKIPQWQKRYEDYFRASTAKTIPADIDRFKLGQIEYIKSGKRWTATQVDEDVRLPVHVNQKTVFEAWYESVWRDLFGKSEDMIERIMAGSDPFGVGMSTRTMGALTSRLRDTIRFGGERAMTQVLPSFDSPEVTNLQKGDVYNILPGIITSVRREAGSPIHEDMLFDTMEELKNYVVENRLPWAVELSADFTPIAYDLAHVNEDLIEQVEQDGVLKYRLRGDPFVTTRVPADNVQSTFAGHIAKASNADTAFIMAHENLYQNCGADKDGDQKPVFLLHTIIDPETGNTSYVFDDKTAEGLENRLFMSYLQDWRNPSFFEYFTRSVDPDNVGSPVKLFKDYGLTLKAKRKINKIISSPDANEDARQVNATSEMGVAVAAATNRLCDFLNHYGVNIGSRNGKPLDHETALNFKFWINTPLINLSVDDPKDPIMSLMNLGPEGIAMFVTMAIQNDKLLDASAYENNGKIAAAEITKMLKLLQTKAARKLTDLARYQRYDVFNIGDDDIDGYDPASGMGYRMSIEKTDKSKGNSIEEIMETTFGAKGRKLFQIFLLTKDLQNLNRSLNLGLRDIQSSAPADIRSTIDDANRLLNKETAIRMGDEFYDSPHADAIRQMIGVMETTFSHDISMSPALAPFFRDLKRYEFKEAHAAMQKALVLSGLERVYPKLDEITPADVIAWLTEIENGEQVDGAEFIKRLAIDKDQYSERIGVDFLERGRLTTDDQLKELRDAWDAMSPKLQAAFYMYGIREYGFQTSDIGGSFMNAVSPEYQAWVQEQAQATLDRWNAGKWLSGEKKYLQDFIADSYSNNKQKMSYSLHSIKASTKSEKVVDLDALSGKPAKKAKSAQTMPGRFSVLGKDNKMVTIQKDKAVGWVVTKGNVTEPISEAQARQYFARVPVRASSEVELAEYDDLNAILQDLKPDVIQAMIQANQRGNADSRFNALRQSIAMPDQDPELRKDALQRLARWLPANDPRITTIASRMGNSMVKTGPEDTIIPQPMPTPTPDEVVVPALDRTRYTTEVMRASSDAEFEVINGFPVMDGGAKEIQQKFITETNKVKAMNELAFRQSKLMRSIAGAENDKVRAAHLLRVAALIADDDKVTVDPWAERDHITAEWADVQKAYAANKGVIDRLIAEYRKSSSAVFNHLNEYLRNLSPDGAIQFWENYVTHLVIPPSDAITAGNALKSLISRPERSRLFPSFTELAKLGFTVEKLDLADINELYSQMTWQNAASRVVIDYAITQVNGAGEQQVIPDYDGKVREPKLLENTVGNLQRMLEDKTKYGNKFSSLLEVFPKLVQRAGLTQRRYIKMNSPYKGYAGFWVHPDSINVMKTILNLHHRFFDQRFVQGIEHANQWMKWMSLQLSAFHPISILEGVGSSLGGHWKLWGFDKTGLHFAWNTQDFRDWLVKHPEFEIELQEAGLEIGRYLDVDASVIGRDLAIAHRWASEHHIKPAVWGIEALQWYKEKVDKHLWRNLHAQSKVYLAYTLMNKWNDLFAKQGKHVNQKQLMREIAQYVNITAGGLDWNTKMWATPTMRRILHLTMFAPDWTFSNIEIARAGAVAVPGLEWLGRDYSMVTRSETARIYWPTTLIFMIGLPNILQALVYMVAGDPDRGDKMFSQQNEADRRTSVDITPLMRKMQTEKGSVFSSVNLDKDERWYMRFGKQVREVGDLIFHPYATLMSKSSMLVKIAYEQAVGNTVNDFSMGFKDSELPRGLFMVDGSFMKSRVGSIVEKFTPMSLGAILKGAPPGAIAPIGKGMTRSKFGIQMTKILHAYSDPTLWEKVQSVPDYERRLDRLAPDLVEAAMANGMNKADIRTIVKEAQTRVLSDWYDVFWRAINTKNDRQAEVAAGAIVRLGAGTANVFSSFADKRQHHTQVMQFGEIKTAVQRYIHEANLKIKAVETEYQ